MRKKIYIIVIIIFVLMLFVSSCVPVCNVPKTVLFDNSHNNKGCFDDHVLTKFATLISVLQTMGYTVNYTSSSGFFPENYGVFIIPIPETEYTGPENQKISAFLSKCERKLLVIGEFYSYYDNTPLNNILTYLGSGISFNNALVKDNVNKYEANSSWIIVNDFITHPVTTGLNSIIPFATTSISVSGNAVALANSSAVSYLGSPVFDSTTSSNYQDNLKDVKADGTIISGPFCVVAAQSLMSGKIVAIGDGNIFSNQGSIPPGEYIDAADNEQLFKNIINW